jgi:hypothetical protein
MTFARSSSLGRGGSVLSITGKLLGSVWNRDPG